MIATNDVDAPGSAPPEAVAPAPHEHWPQALQKLRECLEMELVALEGYDVALTQATNPQVSQRLLELRGDHARRQDLIRSRIQRLGSGTDPTAPTNGVVAVGRSSGDAPLGQHGSVAAVEVLERRGMALYSEGPLLDDPSTRAFFETVLLPAQRRTQDLCRSLEALTRGSP